MFTQSLKIFNSGALSMHFMLLCGPFGMQNYSIHVIFESCLLINSYPFTQEICMCVDTVAVPALNVKFLFLRA